MVTSSRIAAGLMTPITGMRLSLAEDYLAHWLGAVAFYREIERRLGVKFLHSRRHVRLFKSEKERLRWEGKADAEDVLRFIHGRVRADLGLDAAVFTNPCGGFEMKHGGYLDTKTYLDASKAAFRSTSSWVQANVQVGDVIATADGVEWAGQAFGHAIYCIGWEAARHPWFDWVPFKPARGTILTVRVCTGNERRIVHHGCWMLPVGDGVIKAGSTFDFSFDNPSAVPEGDVKLLAGQLGAALRQPFQIVGQASAVRPAIEAQRVLIGRHPAHSRIGFLNGLGSKGTLHAPHYAGLLADHFTSDRPVPPECDLLGNW